MAWSYLSRVFSFSRNVSEGPGHPSSKSSAGSESPHASAASLHSSIANLSIQADLSRQSVAELSLAPLPPITGSSDAEALARQSGSEVPNEISDIAEDVKSSLKSDIADSASDIPFDIVKAVKASPESHVTEAANDFVKVAEPVSEISNDSGKSPNKSLTSHLAEDNSEMPDHIVDELYSSPESNLSESPPVPPPSNEQLTVESIPSRQPATDSSSALRPPNTIYESLEPNLNASELSLMIRSAQVPGNKKVRKQVKALFKKAAKTVRDKLTPSQVFIIDNWDNHSSRSRRSSTFSLRSSGSTTNLPSQLAQASASFSSPKIFVDASGHGIGLVFNDRWLAWTFTTNHPNILLGSNNKIIMSWAEQIAVELGILTLLSGGYRDMKVLVRSDNKDVVKALRRRAWKSDKYGLNTILARILHLCDEAALELDVDWVPSEENPADGPSRGEYPPLDAMLDYSPTLPPHFEGLLIQFKAV